MAADSALLVVMICLIFLATCSTGGTLGGNVSNIASGSRRAGMPEDIFTMTGTYDFGNGWTVNGSIIDVEEVASGYSNAVILPDYTLINLGVSFQTENWLLSVSGKNLSDEKYFRANFPNLFGGHNRFA